MVELGRRTIYSELPNDAFQPVPNWLADQYEALTGSPMPNGHFADREAIDLAIQVCNTFLDNRPIDRDFIMNFFGIEFP